MCIAHLAFLLRSVELGFERAIARAEALAHLYVVVRDALWTRARRLLETEVEIAAGAPTLLDELQAALA